MQHLTEQELVLHHYHDDDSPAAVEQHLASCDSCRREFGAIRNVLAMVDEMPLPHRDAGYGEQVWNRLRWKLGSARQRLRTWQTMLAAAAMLALAFFAGQLWHARNSAPPLRGGPPSSAHLAGGGAGAPLSGSQERILLVVVTDHLDSSERMLIEVANADLERGLDVSTERKRAEDLLVSNRMYRQTASQHGDERLVMILAELEPVLIELAHAPDTLSSDKLATLQKRIESKGLLFKVRAVSAQTGGRGVPPSPKGMSSL